MGKKLPAFVAQWGTIDTPAFYEGQKGWGNHSEPDVYVLDVNQQYPIGTKFVDGERTWMYGYVSTDEDLGERAGNGLLNIGEELVQATAAVTHAIGAREIAMVDTGSATANEYAGGYFMCRTHPTITYRILSNTVASASAFTITLERGLVVAIAASQNVRLNPNQYKNLCTSRSSGRYECSIMGCGMVIPVASRYQWIQTWGPIAIVGGDEVAGATGGLRMCQFNIDGTLVWNGWSGTVGTATGLPYAGYLISDTKGTGSDVASWHTFLMLNR